MNSWDYKYYLHWTDYQGLPHRVGSDNILYIIAMGEDVLKKPLGAQSATISQYKDPQ